jgi:uncharacterized protein YdbL (DUF1318 family)
MGWWLCLPTRTREQLEWIAAEVTDAGGKATVWLARPAAAAADRELAAGMAAARAAEYRAVAAEAEAAISAGQPVRAGQLTQRIAPQPTAGHRWTHAGCPASGSAPGPC